MAGYNKVILIGYTGGDPEPLVWGGGREGSKFRFATSRKGKDGRDVTQWHNILVWSESNAKFANTYVKLGAMLLIEGEIEYVRDEYNGAIRDTTNIVVGAFGGRIEILSSKAEGGATARARGGPAGYAEQSGGRTAPPPPRDLRDDLDDEIPF